jgi:hypothetical protein
MNKKIILKESQYNRILFLLCENNILNNLKENDILVITKDDGDFLTIKIDSINNGVLNGVDENDEEIIIDMSNYSDSNKEILVGSPNKTTKSINYDKIKISNIKLLSKDKEEYESPKDDSVDDVVFNNYYKEIFNDPYLKKAFYKAPTLWNYFTSALTNKKARGTGILPAYELINKYFTRKIDQKLPGFSDKENKRAQFYLYSDLEIPYDTLTGEKNKFLSLNSGYHKATVRQFEAGLGDVKVLTYRSGGGNFGFKIIVKKPTGDRPDEYLCDIYVYKNNVQENRYKVENIKIKFINSEGYTSYNNLKKANK